MQKALLSFFVHWPLPGNSPLMILSTLSFQTLSLGSSSFWPPQLTAQMGNPRAGEVLLMRPGSACPSSAHTPATAPQHRAGESPALAQHSRPCPRVARSFLFNLRLILSHSWVLSWLHFPVLTADTVPGHSNCCQRPNVCHMEQVST